MKVLRSSLALACAAGAFLGVGGGAVAQPRLSVVDLRGIGDAESSTLVDINNSGVAIGWTYEASVFRPILYSAATGLQDFAGLVGAAPGASISLYDINDRGQVVGEWDGRAFQYAAATGVQFLSSGGPAAAGAALRINEAGQVALRHDGGSYLYTPGQGEVALPLSFNAGGLGLNNAGATAGIVSPDGTVAHAARRDADGTLTDLGTLGGSNSYANDMNEAGDVVGYSWRTGDVAGTLPFRALAGGAMALLDIGGLDPSAWIISATTINDDGLISGILIPDDLNGPGSAFLYHDDFGFADANTLLSAEDAAHWRLFQIGRFNDAGYATVYANVDGFTYAALVHLDMAAPVPEPQAVLTMLVALPALALAARRRRRGPAA